MNVERKNKKMPEALLDSESEFQTIVYNHQSKKTTNIQILDNGRRTIKLSFACNIKILTICMSHFGNGKSFYEEHKPMGQVSFIISN